MKKFLAYFFLFLLSIQNAPVVLAANYDLKRMTPEIEQAFAGRQSRYEQLRSLKAAGRIGEDNRGYVQARDHSSALSGLVDAENADRRLIYNGVVEQNRLGPNGIPQVEAIFAGVQRDKAKSGDPIQLPNGEWLQKNE